MQKSCYVWNTRVAEVPPAYPVLLATANQLYVTPVFVLTLNSDKAAPLVLDVRLHTVAPFTVMVTVAPETALPPLLTVVFRVTVDPFYTLAPLAGLISATDNDFGEVVVTMTRFTC
jgi:hypothetical protein